MDKKQSTLSSYSDRLRIQLLPFFGKMFIKKIKAEHIEKFKAEMAKEYAPKTVNYALAILHSILNLGVKWGHLMHNPTRFVKKLTLSKRERPSLTKEEVDQLLDAAEGQGKVLLMTVVATGMRMGEILAMTWDNLDLQHGIYKVTESFSGQRLGTPKTEASAGLVFLPPHVLKALKEHKEKQDEQRKEAGGDYQNQRLIFATEKGTFINPSNLRNRIFYPALRKSGLEKTFRLHDFRGICPTLMYENGADPNLVMKQLRHKTAKFALEVYAGINQEARKNFASKFGNYLFGIRQLPLRVIPTMKFTVSSDGLADLVRKP